jgi:heme exporter protein C
MQRKLTILVYWTAIAAMFAAAVWFVAAHTPSNGEMGPTQRVFYLHMPVAINTFLASLTVFVASVGYLWQRNRRWDDLAASAANVAVVYCSLVLLTGMIWGRGAWGSWWVWSPRLTFSLMLWVLYVVYVAVRKSIDSAERRAMVSAVYGVIAFMDVPLVYLSARLVPDVHPSSIAMTPAMHVALIGMTVPVTLAAVGLIAMQYMLARASANGVSVTQDGSRPTMQVGIKSLLGSSSTRLGATHE